LVDVADEYSSRSLLLHQSVGFYCDPLLGALVEQPPKATIGFTIFSLCSRLHGLLYGKIYLYFFAFIFFLSLFILRLSVCLFLYASLCPCGQNISAPNGRILLKYYFEEVY
jgi:hypothetical protein